MSDAPFRIVAEVLRIGIRSRNRASLVSGCFANSRFDLWPIAHLLYSATSPVRLSDEDLREVFFCLTGAYPEEVEEQPDLIRCLARLSESTRTTATAGRVSKVVEDILVEERTNEERATLLRPLFSRIEARDMESLVLRLSHHRSRFKRDDIISGLLRHCGEQVGYRSLRRATILRGLREVCSLVSKGDFDAILEAQQPVLGRGVAVMSPMSYDLNKVMFQQCFFTFPEGEWMTLHVLDGRMLLFDSAGIVREDVLLDDNIPPWAVPLTVLDQGVFLVEYAWGRDMEFLVLDRWSPVTKQTASFNARRETIPHIVRKPMTHLKNAASVSEFIVAESPILMFDAFAHLSYENRADEVVIINGKPNRCIFRVLGGVWSEPSLGMGLRLCKWKIAGLDGDDYMEVGTLEADLEMMKRLSKKCVESLPVEGEFAPIESPTFVEVDVHGAGWGEVGPYVQGRMLSVIGSAGKADVVRVEQIDLLMDGMGNGREDEQG